MRVDDIFYLALNFEPFIPITGSQSKELSVQITNQHCKYESYMLEPISLSTQLYQQDDKKYPAPSK